MQRLARDEVGSASTSRSSLHTALFGQARGIQTKQSPADKLQSAAASVEHRVEELTEKASLARARAAELLSQGQRPTALAALKKAKLLEKQIETATATHAALESQVDVLSQAALQREVASALSASVATSKT